ncbi:PAS domain-containing sensor histidine kinase [Hymenobacter koreensis]|uniref:histidine kinase n=1 Tax=Hymenobacter koreensis TaxID=1084523 RepID=A0ABP8IUY2_9BACT
MHASAPLPDYLLLFRHWPGNYLLLLPDATVIDTTNAHAAASYKSREEVVGRPLLEVFPVTDAAEAAVLLASLAWVRQNLAPHTLPVLRYHLEKPAAQGGGFEEMYWQATHFPVLDEAGQLRYILQKTDDVTAQHRLEHQNQAALTESQDLNRFLLEDLPVMIWLTQPDGLATYRNPQWRRYTGRSEGPDNAVDWIEDLHPDDRQRVAQAWQQAVAAGATYEVEYRLRRYDGQYRWQLVRGVPRRNAAGEILAWAGTATEIHDQKLAQHKTEARDEQLRQILGQVPAFIATVNGPEHRFTFFTPSYNELMGGRVQLGLPAAELLPEVAQQGFVELLETVYRSNTPYIGLETPIHLLNPATGTLQEHYLDFVYQPLSNAQGQPDGIMAFGVEVTKQVRARQQAEALQLEMQRRDEQLRILAATVPVFISTLDLAGAVTYINDSAFEYTGESRSGAAAGLWNAIHPDDVEALTTSHALALASLRPWQSPPFRFRRHDGQYRWFLTRQQPYYDADGQVVGFSAATVEIHEQQELQAQLQQSEAHFRFLAESVPQIIWTATADGQVDYFNERVLEATGLRPDQCLGSSAWGALIHPEDQLRTFAVWEQAYSSGQRYEIEYRFITPADGYRWYLGRAEPLRNEAGEVVRWFGSCTDIHDVKQAQQQLLLQNAQLTQTTQALDNFVYTASHDLKQPVNNMAGIFQELIRTAQFHDPETELLTGMFERALQQIHSTIQDLTDVVQVQRHHQHLQTEPVELRPFMQEVIGSMQSEADRLGALFELDFDQVPTLLFVRPNLQSILYNLLSNSLKYAHPERPPRVRVSARTAPNSGTLLVFEDNGLGLDLPRYGPELFQLFRRFHDHVPGSGMGLYLVQRIVQQAGGKIEVSSTPGFGTTFRILLPANEHA